MERESRHDGIGFNYRSWREDGICADAHTITEDSTELIAAGVHDPASEHNAHGFFGTLVAVIGDHRASLNIDCSAHNRVPDKA